jgi:ribosome-binding factor A
MRHHFPAKNQIRGLCAELGEEDGLDPRLAPRRTGHGGRHHSSSGPGPGLGFGPQGRPVDRKACQLCRQVAVTLDEVLADCGDSVLQNLYVVDVTPFPDASRLMVAVASVDGKTERELGPEVVLEHLQHASGHLRCEVAAAVTRKRAPVLIYRLAYPALLREEA